MKRSRFSEEQVAYALRRAEQGTPVPDVCRSQRISGDVVDEIRRLMASVGPELHIWAAARCCRR